MAKEKIEAVAPVKEKEPAYPVKELAAVSKKLFGCNKEVVIAATRGQEELTVSEAKAVIKKFLEKEVR